MCEQCDNENERRAAALAAEAAQEVADVAPVAAPEPTPEPEPAPEVCATCEESPDDCTCSTCERCDERVLDSDVRVLLEMRAHRWQSADTTYCESCADRRELMSVAGVRYTRSDGLGSYGAHCVIDTSDLVRNSDSGDYGTQEYASEHWYYHENDDAYHSEPEESDDDDSDDDDSDENSGLLSYGTDVLDRCAWPSETPRDSLCYGVELEMEAEGGSVRDIVEQLDRSAEHHILKSDGSLNNGAELVTVPFTLEGHRTLYPWAHILKTARSVASSGDTSTCGMHIHVNRRALSPMTLGKMLVFVNAPQNVAYIKTVAQRDPSRWAAFKEKTLADGEKLSDSRYEAINVTSKTAEFRIFRGNLRLERVMKNLEFVDALIHFCAKHRPGRMTWRAFVYWLKHTKRDYPNLRAFLAEKGIFELPAPDAPEHEPELTEENDDDENRENSTCV